MSDNSVHFAQPVQIGEVSVTSITLRDVLVEDELEAQARASIRAARAGRPQPLPGEIEVELLAILTGLPADGLRKMASRPYRRLQAVLLDFFSAAETSPPAPPPLAAGPATDGSPSAV